MTKKTSDTESKGVIPDLPPIILSLQSILLLLQGMN